MILNRSDLFRNEAFINGQWRQATSRKTYPVLNPYNLQKLADVADLGLLETREAIQAAAQAFPLWRSKTALERARILRKWYNLQIQHLDDLAIILTAEQGKPLSEAKGEIKYGASFVEWYAEEGKRVYGDIIPGHTPETRIMTIKQPIGVVGAITPWNFPNAMITRKVAPALAAGCTVVIKPAEDTPLSALALAVLAEQAGFPPGVINIITSNAPDQIGKELTSNPLIRKISFTGSTQTGKLLMRQSAGTVKKISLELGGNAPFIVFDDADIDMAVDGAIASKYRNAGQTCICANRLFVQNEVYEVFTQKLKHAVEKQKVGSGMDPEVVVGPLINSAALRKVEYLMEDAVRKGASILTGGKPLTLAKPGLFYAPTVLTGVDDLMEIFQTEIFGPIAPIYGFETEAEVIALANKTPFGLAAYLYGQDYARIWRVAEALEYGMVGINTGIISTASAPFGGVKESGIGREGSKYGIEEYLEIKYVCWGGIK
jgi:succinate-semialdehyde dehydrogenase/glutarate-semialdehyde dehydrogenase